MKLIATLMLIIMILTMAMFWFIYSKISTLIDRVTDKLKPVSQVIEVIEEEPRLRRYFNL